MINPSSFVEYDLVVLELLWVWLPASVPTTPATPAPLVMSGFGVTESNPASFLYALSKKSSSSSSSWRLLHQTRKKISPAMSATPTSVPMTMPAIPPPDKDRLDALPDLLFAAEVLSDCELIVVVTSITDALDDLLGEVTVETSVVTVPREVFMSDDCPEDEELEELTTVPVFVVEDADEDGAADVAEVWLVVADPDEDLELPELSELVVGDCVDIDSDSEEPDRVEDRLSAMVEPTTSLLTYT